MAYNDYNFGTSARKFDERRSYDYSYDRELEVRAGGARNAKPQTMPATAAMAIKAMAVFVVVFAMVGMGRISLSSMSVAAAIEANQLSQDIYAAREAGNSLEVEQSTLSNPTRIKTEAKKLAMSEPDQTHFMVLPEDIVVTDAEGNLSLSGSIEAVAKAQ